MDRKKKIKIIQAGLFLAGGILFLIMYLNTNKVTNIEIVSKKKQEEVKQRHGDEEDRTQKIRDEM